MINKIEIKKDILKQFNKVTFVPHTFEELVIKFEISEEDKEKFSSILNEMIDNYDIFLTKRKDRYLSSRLANKYKGIMSIRNEDYGFVNNEFYPDFYVNAIDFNESMDKDEVLYTVIDDLGYGKSSQAVILKVLKRHYEYLVGEVYYKQGKYFLDPNNKYIKGSILIVNNPQSKLIKTKDIVRTKIVKYGENLKVEVTEVLGDNNTIGIDILQVLAQYGIRKDFNDEVVDCVNNIQNDIESERIKRIDYTNKIVFTIDGDDAKDLDDAVSIVKLANGNYELGVYIADVTHYVKEGSALDEEALLRGTSIYLTDRVIPMLPVRLSNDLCSLNPNEDKLVIACIMEVNSNGEVVDSKLTEGIIKTTKRLSYDKCNDVIKNGLVNYPDYDVAINSLLEMAKLAKILEQKRYKRGAINFDLDEAKIIVDSTGKAIDVVKRIRDVSEKIIEEFMILANETVAEFITALDLPFIYRVHDKPDNVKFQTLKSMCNQLGYKILGIYPKEVQKLMESLTEKDEYLKNTVLRLMAKAVYSEDNIGHFGLASRCYTHFTSPIRRYPDQICHRLIRKYIFEVESFSMLSKEDYVIINTKIAQMAKQCSESERISNDIEYQVIDMKEAEYMADYVGEVFNGVVSSVLKFGMFVTLDNTIEGLISSRVLSDKHFEYNEYFKAFVNRFNNKKITLGDKVKVKLIKTNKKLGEIDFDLVYNNNSGVRHYGKSKGYFKK